jgi:DNA-binding transcriptional LysR family regulator
MSEPSHLSFCIDDAALFLRVQALGSLSAAARERQWPVSQVSRALARLEKQAGVRLMHRSTHGLSLTDEGDTFAEHARHMVNTAELLQAELSGRRLGASGWVRVAVSPALAEGVLAPSLASLYERWPDLHLEICADDRIVDMARDGIDLAIRTGNVHQEGLIARNLGSYGRVLCASPGYLQRFGSPQTLDDLGRHRLIGSSVSAALNRWPLKASAGGGQWAVHAHTRTDNSAALLALVLQGVGIARLAEPVARVHLANGSLQPLMTDVFEPQQVPVAAVMRPDRQRLPKVRACLEWWTGLFAETVLGQNAGRV